MDLEKGNLNIFGTAQSERMCNIILQKMPYKDINRYSNFLIFSYLYCQILKTYKNKEKVDYSNFFEEDDIFIYSFIIHTNLYKITNIIHSNIVDLKQTADIQTAEKYLKNLTILITEYIQLSLLWYNNLSPKDTIKTELLRCALDGFVPKLYILYTVVSTLNKTQPKDYYQNFLNVVEKTYKTYNFPLNKITEGNKINSKNLSEYVFDAFRDVSELILVELGKAQEWAQKNFNKVLLNGSHNPHITLFLTFIKLLEQIDTSFYKIINRHLEYYYEGVLMFKKKKEKKDKTLIFCIYDEINNIKTLPKFTKILGGKDNKNQDIIFQTDETTQISNLKIKTIRTILYSEITLNNIDKFPTSHIEIATYDMFDVYSKNQKLYLFSKKDSNAAILSKSKNKTPFSLVFFSSILKLQEGEREISIKFYPTKFSLQHLLKALKKLNLFIGNENDSLKIFANILLKTIVFQYTTIDKIVVIDKKNITFLWSEDEEAFIANIKINADMPSFMSTEEENLKIDNKGLYLQMVYVNAALSWSSTLFQNLAFSSIKISVKVKNCKSLILQNDFGLIENNISFEPFGPMPKVGSSFFIGSEEIFNNNLKDLKLNIEWDNLPENFEKHYQNYGINIKNSDFNINISFLQQGYWYPLEESSQQTFPLFDVIVKNETEELKTTKTIEGIDLSLLQLTRKHNFDFSTPFLYSGTVGGFLRIQLCTPNIAFAHSIYPQLLTQTKTLNKNKFFKKFINDVEINEPYTPKIKNFNIDYVTEEEIDHINYSILEDCCVIHTYPFGYNKMSFFAENEIQSFSDQSNWLIGTSYATVNIELSNLSTPTFTLYISIDEVSILQNSTIDKPIWRYLSNNCWCDFNDSSILYDSTANLTKSGFIKFKTPHFIKKKNTICEGTEEGTNWIQIEFIRPQKYLPTIIGIFSEVIPVTRISNNTKNKINAGSLKEINDPNFKNVKIFQPFNSFGGKNEESKEEMYIRISERLNHKDRAITVKDYERIILEKFPEVLIAKCLNHTCSKNIKEISPGYVTIIVLVDNNLTVENNRKFPQASIELLNIIKKEIQKHSSPLVQIDVINPIFEKIKFIFKVKICDHKQSDVYIKKLNIELKNLISPWLYSSNNQNFYNKSIKALDIIRFIKTRDYVENIDNFMILKIYKNETTIFRNNNDEVYPSFPHSFFYSANTHNIIVDDTLNCEENNLSLENMNIEQDFIVGPVIQQETKKDFENQDNVKESIDDFYMYLKK